MNAYWKLVTLKRWLVIVSTTVIAGEIAPVNDPAIYQKMTTLQTAIISNNHVEKELDTTSLTEQKLDQVIKAHDLEQKKFSFAFGDFSNMPTSSTTSEPLFLKANPNNRSSEDFDLISPSHRLFTDDKDGNSQFLLSNYENASPSQPSSNGDLNSGVNQNSSNLFLPLSQSNSQNSGNNEKSTCGNQIIEPEEGCDDGNETEGDGCKLCQCEDADGDSYYSILPCAKSNSELDCDDHNANVKNDPSGNCASNQDHLDCNNPSNCEHPECATNPVCLPKCIDLDQDQYGSNCPQGNDCDDYNDSIHPNTNEICDDLVDNNCNQLIDLSDVSDCGCNQNATCELLRGETTENCPTDCIQQKCGNGKVETNETCDGADLNNQTCQNLGYDGGTLSCESDCSGFNTANCTQCGNSMLELGESCDDGNLQNNDGCSESCQCEDFDQDGYFPLLVCAGNNPDVTDCNDLDSQIHPGAFDQCGDGIDSDCNDIDLNCPSTCGNNQAEFSEVCDGTDLRGETCISQGYAGGIVSCVSDCSALDVSQCEECGNGKLENSESCDDGNKVNGDGCSKQCECEDADQDGYYPLLECAGDGIHVDCNDNDNSIHPTAPDICEDGIDSNCDNNDLCQPGTCGNGLCEEEGEDNANCPQDCPLHFLKFFDVRFDETIPDAPKPIQKGQTLAQLSISFPYQNLDHYPYIEIQTIAGHWHIKRNDDSAWNHFERYRAELSENDAFALFQGKSLMRFDEFQKAEINTIHKRITGQNQDLNYGVATDPTGCKMHDDPADPDFGKLIPCVIYENGQPKRTASDSEYRNGETMVVPSGYNLSTYPDRLNFNFANPAVREYLAQVVKKHTDSYPTSSRMVFIDNIRMQPQILPFLAGQNDTEKAQNYAQFHNVIFQNLQSNGYTIIVNGPFRDRDIVNPPFADYLTDSAHCYIDGALFEDRFNVCGNYQTCYLQDLEGSLTDFLAWLKRLKNSGVAALFSTNDRSWYTNQSPYMYKIWLWVHLTALKDTETFFYMNYSTQDPMIHYSFYDKPLGLPLETEPVKDTNISGEKIWTRAYERGKIVMRPTRNYGSDYGEIYLCGDTILEAGEGCDDGNFLSGDGCSDLCQLE